MKLDRSTELARAGDVIIAPAKSFYPDAKTLAVR